MTLELQEPFELDIRDSELEELVSAGDHPQHVPSKQPLSPHDFRDKPPRKQTCCIIQGLHEFRERIDNHFAWPFLLPGWLLICLIISVAWIASIGAVLGGVLVRSQVLDLKLYFLQVITMPGAWMIGSGTLRTSWPRLQRVLSPGPASGSVQASQTASRTWA
jgi:hypothetical protein